MAINTFSLSIPPLVDIVSFHFLVIANNAVNICVQVFCVDMFFHTKCFHLSGVYPRSEILRSRGNDVSQLEAWPYHFTFLPASPKDTVSSGAALSFRVRHTCPSVRSSGNLLDTGDGQAGVRAKALRGPEGPSKRRWGPA